jgi:hypothetical protein
MVLVHDNATAMTQACQRLLLSPTIATAAAASIATPLTSLQVLRSTAAALVLLPLALRTLLVQLLIVVQLQVQLQYPLHSRPNGAPTVLTVATSGQGVKPPGEAQWRKGEI